MAFQNQNLNLFSDYTGSKYEDVATVARIGTADMQLQGKFDTFHREILENFYRLAGHIYSGADLAKLRLENRPDFEWNLFLPIILSIVGNFQKTIPGLDFTGITPDDNQGAELQQKLSEFFMYGANDISYELAKAFLYAVVGRIGWVKTSYTYLKDDEGMVDYSWYDPLRLKFDTNWQRRDTSDMRFIDDSGWYEVAEIIDIYAKRKPDMREELYNKALLIVGESALKKGRMKAMMLTWAERFLNVSQQYSGRKHGYNSNFNDVNYNMSGTWYNGDGRFKVVDWYEKRLQPTLEVTDLATGKIEDISDDVVNPDKNRQEDRDWFDREKLQTVLQRYQQPKVQQTWKTIIWQTTVVPALNMVLHDAPQQFQSKLFKFIPVLCFDFHPDVLEYKSIMDHIIDPVSSYNLRRNTILTYVMKLANGGYIAEKGAVRGNEESLLSNEIGGLKKVNDGALAQKRFIVDKPAAYPDALGRVADADKADLWEISGLPPNARGVTQTTNESGNLFQARVQQADVMQTWISSNAQAALVLVARNGLAIAQRFLTAERTLQLMMDETNPYWITINKYYMGKIINDVSYGKYNIRVSPSPYGRYAQDREFQKTMQINQWLGTLNPQFVDPRIALKQSGLSAAPKMISHIDKILGIMEQQQLGADAMQAEQDAQSRIQAAMNMNKFIQELNDKTLRNYELSDKIATDQMMKIIMLPNMMKQLGSGSPAAASPAPAALPAPGGFSTPITNTANLGTPGIRNNRNVPGAPMLNQ